MTKDKHRPAGITMHIIGDDVEIVYRPSRLAAIPLVLFTVVWTGSSLAVFLGTAATFVVGMNPVFLLAALFVGLFVLVGIYLVWLTARALLNRVCFQLMPHAMTVRHVPIPTTDDHYIDRRLIERVYSRVQRVPEETDTYNLVIEQKGDDELVLLSQIYDESTVLFIAQKIEDYYTTD